MSMLKNVLRFFVLHIFLGGIQGNESVANRRLLGFYDVILYEAPSKHWPGGKSKLSEGTFKPFPKPDHPTGLERSETSLCTFEFDVMLLC